MKVKIGVERAFTHNNVRYVSDSEGFIDAPDDMALEIKKLLNLEDDKTEKTRKRRGE